MLRSHAVHGRVIVHADLDCFYCQVSNSNYGDVFNGTAFYGVQYKGTPSLSLSTELQTQRLLTTLLQLLLTRVNNCTSS